MSSITSRLLVGVSRDRKSTANQVEVLVDGQRVGRFAVPVRGAKGSAAQSIPLKQYLGQRIAIQVIQLARDERSQVHWQTLSVVD